MSTGPHKKTLWTPEKVKLLKAMLKDGKSSGIIGKELGFTRNSVVSKVKRSGLRLNGAHFGADANKANGKKHKPKRRNIVVPTVPRVHLNAEVAVTPPATWPEAPNEYSVLIWKLTTQTCRWPLWTASEGPEHNHYCGVQKEKGSAYCKKHRGVYNRRDWR